MSTGVSPPASGDDGADQIDDDIVEAMGTLGEAYEYLIRARGHLYSFHQLMGRVDFLFGDAADQFDDAGRSEAADELRAEIVGRNVLDGRWTFQVVEEFDDLYWDAVHGTVRDLQRRYQGGRRHVHESRMKDERRSSGRAGHERRPPGAHEPEVDTEEDGPPTRAEQEDA